MDLDACDQIFDNAMLSTTEGEFCNRISPLFDAYEIISIGLGRGSIFWRARVITDTIFSNVSDLTYPPATFAGLGRLNDVGASCFYAARDMHTALHEVEAKEDQLVQIAGYRVLSDEMLRLIVIGEYANVQKHGYMQFSGSDPGGTIRQLMNEDEKAPSKVYIDKMLASILGDVKARASNYVSTRSLGALLHAKVDADGIIFPSVRDPGGFNLAVKPASADRALHNVACLQVKVGRLRKFCTLDHEILSSAVRLDDLQNFIWPGKLDGRKINLYNMNREEYEFQASRQNDKNAMADLLAMHSSRTNGDRG